MLVGSSGSFVQSKKRECINESGQGHLNGTGPSTSSFQQVPAIMSTGWALAAKTWNRYHNVDVGCLVQWFRVSDPHRHSVSARCQTQIASLLMIDELLVVTTCSCAHTVQYKAAITLPQVWSGNLISARCSECREETCLLTMPNPRNPVVAEVEHT